MSWPKAPLFCISMLVVSACVQVLHATESKVGTVYENANEHRALYNYQMFCQGCHVADGSGHKSVPQLKGFIHNFLTTQQGREYLIRVPGAANSVLDDQQLAEVMNWMLRNFGDRNQSDWQPYDSAEVAQYRKEPLNETVKYREKVVARLKTGN